MEKSRVNVAIVGLGFGTQFIPIYKRHPMTNMYAICRRSRVALDEVGNAFGVERRYERFSDVLADPDIDFVHINSPLTDHGWMSIAALKAESRPLRHGLSAARKLPFVEVRTSRRISFARNRDRRAGALSAFSASLSCIAPLASTS